MKYSWAIPTSFDKDNPRVAVTPAEKKIADAWLMKYASRLPSENAGDDERVGLYEFTLANTDELDADDQDGVEFSQESFRVAGPRDPRVVSDAEKDHANAGESTLDKVAESEAESEAESIEESSGPLKSSWRLIEKSLASMFKHRPDKLSPSQWVRWERSKAKLGSIQHRGSRKDLRVQNSWDRAWQDFVGLLPETFFTTRWSTQKAFDFLANDFREVQRFEVLSERLTAPGPVREWPEDIAHEMNGAGLTTKQKVAVMREHPRLGAWLELKNYDAWLRYHESICASSAASPKTS